WILAVFLLPIGISGLQCYNGYTLLRGQSIVGKDPQTCSPGASCIFASVNLHPFVKPTWSGCSTKRCYGIKLAGKDNCFNYTLGSMKVMACCCDGNDFCTLKKDKNGSMIDIVKDKLRKWAGGIIGG
ncbi:hypothetical protein PMAYCL1PPCAC_32476, partial [Pristionchus mayeri]